jgi:hypothetical protein
LSLIASQQHDFPVLARAPADLKDAAARGRSRRERRFQKLPKVLVPKAQKIEDRGSRIETVSTKKDKCVHAAEMPATPPPVVVATRLLLLVTAASIVGWALGPLGGVSISPERDPATHRVLSTSRLFNWHPVLMSAALLGFCGEALLAYRAAPASPLALAPVAGLRLLLARRRSDAADGSGAGLEAARGLDVPLGRPARKAAHACSHLVAALLASLGLAAAWRSHSLADPPIPQLYSPHSWLGLAAVAMFLAQAAGGCWAYLSPPSVSPPAGRAAFSPLHRRAGLCIFFTGLAAAATGVQEKATFAQAFGKADVRGAAVRSAAAAEVGLLLCGLSMAACFFDGPASPSPGEGGAGGGGEGEGRSGAYGRADGADEEGLLPRPAPSS